MKKVLTVNSIFCVLLAIVFASASLSAAPITAQAAAVKISCSKTASKNSYNNIKIKGKKNTKYYIRICCPKGSWSTSKTVTGKNKCKKTNKSGNASWKFKVGTGSTSKGTYKIYIYSDKSCKKQVAKKTFKVK